MTPFLSLILILITLYIIMIIGSRLIKIILLLLMLSFIFIYLSGDQETKQKFDNTVVKILTKIKSNNIVDNINENSKKLFEKAKNTIKTNN